MRFDGKEIILAALFGAWGLALPVLFHMIGLGSIFLPMFIPLAIMGFFVNFPLALLNGLLIPIVSSLLTGMPPLYPPLAIIISIETGALAGIISLCYRYFKWNIWISLLLGIVVERIILVLAALWIAPVFDFPPYLLSLGSLTASMPGIILLIILVPLIVKSVERLYISKR